jgi:hypothetical protein
VAKTPRKATRGAGASAAAPSANARGEHKLTLAGITYKLRPTYEAGVEIEEKTGLPLRKLAALANTGDLNLSQIGIVAGAYIRAGADGDELVEMVDDERIGQLAYEEGMPSIIARLALVLIDVLLGGRKATGEAKAAVA